MACACRPSPAPPNRARHHCEKGAARPLWERLMLDNNSYDYRLTWPVNPDAPEDSNEAKTPFIDNGTGIIAKERYYENEWMEKKWSRLWSRVWGVRTRGVWGKGGSGGVESGGERKNKNRRMK